MGSHTDKPPLAVLLGQTASGKSALAAQLADHFDIEIIAADARTVYKGMDIGTAKPDAKERLSVPHHMLDIASPDEVFTVADFKRLAEEKIQAINDRGKLPLLVGGSGLYIYAVLYDFAFRGPVDLAERARLEALSVDELQQLINERGLQMPANSKNPRHLISVLQTGHIVTGQQTLRPNTLVMGMEVPSDQLETSIHSRVRTMIHQGLEAEVRGLVEQYGWQAETLNQTIGYEEFRPYFEGTCSIEEVVQQIQLHTRRLAKRQKTWFKRNPDIHWISETAQAVDLLSTFLNK